MSSALLQGAHSCSSPKEVISDRTRMVKQYQDNLNIQSLSDECIHQFFADQSMCIGYVGKLGHLYGSDITS